VEVDGFHEVFVHLIQIFFEVLHIIYYIFMFIFVTDTNVGQ